MASFQDTCTVFYICTCVVQDSLLDYLFCFYVFQDPVVFSTWDLAGQEVYYATHQCFLSRNTLYLAAWNMAGGEKEIKALRPWLLNIQVCAFTPHTLFTAVYVRVTVRICVIFWKYFEIVARGLLAVVIQDVLQESGQGGECGWSRGECGCGKNETQIQ